MSLKLTILRDLRLILSRSAKSVEVSSSGCDDMIYNHTLDDTQTMKSKIEMKFDFFCNCEEVDSTVMICGQDKKDQPH